MEKEKIIAEYVLKGIRDGIFNSRNLSVFDALCAGYILRYDDDVSLNIDLTCFVKYCKNDKDFGGIENMDLEDLSYMLEYFVRDMYFHFEMEDVDLFNAMKNELESDDKLPFIVCDFLDKRNASA